MRGIVITTIARILRLLAIAIAAHGLSVALFAMVIEPRIGDSASEFLESFVFFALFVPASFLVLPFRSVLWSLGLIHAPGWFTYPKPLGYVLAYTIWCGGLLAVSLVLPRVAGMKGKTEG